MPYSAEISRRQPSCFIFLVDQSGSMADGFGGADSGVMVQKAQVVADAVNRLLDSLGQRCVKGNEIYDYFDVGVIGYSSEVQPIFAGDLAQQYMAPISKIYESPAALEQRMQKIPDGMGGFVEVCNEFPVWFYPQAGGGTAMGSVFEITRSLLVEWTAKHPFSYPPTVINITDGESTDGDPRAMAAALREVQTSDGTVLLYNIHLSSEAAPQVAFPSTPEVLYDPYAKLMFEISSPLPQAGRRAAEKEGYRITPESRAFMFNADPVKLIQFLDIGTRTDNLR
ncbi:MAG: VWA domain-containing protein [Oscillatoriales cyanobacterium SM2_2_1]|nr:VWA domain-containing protein [Oscillatoriales cyanobacterium SM2_2_1]